ncbi:hypothetical protein GCM10023188_18650 [Pontibacter saemangeumensis]|uniref:SpoIIAA-like n=1 Tax=Pontibacter saemangeumensis TaxID=1084525 RepID=A0ABP8LKZ6_9BACT
MRIHSELVNLDYNPATDVLTVEWPDIRACQADEISLALGDIVGNIRNFGVRRLLVDSRKTAGGISDGQYEKVTARFIRDIIASPVEKVARLESADAAREARLAGLVRGCRMTIAFRNFATREEAVRWLEQGVYSFR